VRSGLKIQTHSRRAVEARRSIVELLLANHPDDCLYCVRNGNCQLQGLAEELGVRTRKYPGKRHVSKKDVSSASIVRDPDKCILCGKCVRICEEVQGVSAIDFVNRGCAAFIGTAFDKGLNLSSCINCGQCILICPTGALTEQPHIKRVQTALADPTLTVVVQHAPSVSVSIAEEFGLKPGVDVAGAMVTALRRLGFARVFDTGFTADLTIMEEASELVHRVKTGGKLPMLTSCSPGWIKFIEQTYPEYLDHVSTCKSPQQMMGALIKNYWAAKEGLNPDKVYSVSIMPCVAKKFEAGRPEFSTDGRPDIDAVLTTRELAQMIKAAGLNLADLESGAPDTPLGERSTAGKIFGATGGVMEAALRTGYFLITGQELGELKFKPLRGLKGVKEASVQINGLTVNVAVANGLANAQKLMEQVKAGRKDLHFIEVMTCPGGCIAGGGQPIGTDLEKVQARMKALYDIDRDEPIRTSHGNQWVARLYKEFLGQPLGEKSHHLLHTHYHSREVLT
jgi:NADH-quinone oxidoreductase subunit G/NADP-reducing hydrogenase subunit HndD